MSAITRQKLFENKVLVGLKVMREACLSCTSKASIYSLKLVGFDVLLCSENLKNSAYFLFALNPYETLRRNGNWLCQRASVEARFL
ncbi:hypothetical protein [Pseudomonas chlororaphis]|uniref:hypothetical protein n=1 Tax=Pseudomonas chlororaphis TaxID=587753 RepID=UPI0012D30DBB|nr:hypothetical protein [Pseudomonas chlororaphis]